MNVNSGRIHEFLHNMIPTIIAIAIILHVIGTAIASPAAELIANASHGSHGGCHFPLSLQGIFNRAGVLAQRRSPPQLLIDNHDDEVPLELEKFVIARSAISHWGVCYDQPAPNTYILRSRQSIEGVRSNNCFRCVSLVMLVPNVVQSLQAEGE